MYINSHKMSSIFYSRTSTQKFTHNEYFAVSLRCNYINVSFQFYTAASIKMAALTYTIDLSKLTYNYMANLVKISRIEGMKTDTSDTQTDVEMINIHRY